jgi:hypothetical protein
MDKPFVGYNKRYSDNYNRIFRKTLLEKIKIKIDNFLYKLFLNGEKNGKY